ncbi:hypothetical protein D3C84_1197410 [compost metagenome]
MKSLTEEANKEMSPEERREHDEYKAKMFKLMNDILQGKEERPRETLVWISGGPNPTVKKYEI